MSSKRKNCQIVYLGIVCKWLKRKTTSGSFYQFSFKVPLLVLVILTGILNVLRLICLSFRNDRMNLDLDLQYV